MGLFILTSYTGTGKTEGVEPGKVRKWVDNMTDLGGIIKQQRRKVPLTLRKMAAISGISPSYLGRIERGERFPSASVLRKIAKPLGFQESELFSLAGYLSPPAARVEEERPGYSGGRLDPYVIQILSKEPVEVQRTVIAILNILKGIAVGLQKRKND